VKPSEFLATMERREDLLRELADEPLEKPALEECLDVSRSTVDRGIRELEECALVTRTDDGYCRTLPGRIALEEYDRFRGRIEGLCDGTPLVRSLDESVAIDGALLGGARVVESDRASPKRPTEALFEVVDRADAVMGFSPSVHSRQIDTYRRRVFQEGMEAELVLTDRAIDRLVADYDDTFEAALESDRMQFWRVECDLPYSVTLAESGDGTTVGVLVYSEGTIQGCILNDDPAAVDWARQRFQQVQQAAEPVG
jgi:predicted transcriptional regulator